MKNAIVMLVHPRWVV